jgi:hypothetical protein
MSDRFDALLRTEILQLSEWAEERVKWAGVELGINIELWLHDEFVQNAARGPYEPYRDFGAFLLEYRGCDDRDSQLLGLNLAELKLVAAWHFLNEATLEPDTGLADQLRVAAARLVANVQSSRIQLLH